jgi:hypothetical protein
MLALKAGPRVPHLGLSTGGQALSEMRDRLAHGIDRVILGESVRDRTPAHNPNKQQTHVIVTELIYKEI